MSSVQTSTTTREKVREREKIEPPPKWKVIFHNDDITTMDFVVMVLMRIFGKTPDVAMRIMLKVHNEGSALAGIYPKELAEMRVMETRALARGNGFPLYLTMEKC